MLETNSRTERLAAARLYFACEARPGGRDPGPLLDAALAGGVDAIQLRDRSLDDSELIAAAVPFRAAADSHNALFFVNDRPDLVKASGADGAHVGQDDMQLAEARDRLPAGALLGLSTHSRGQIEAAHASGAAPDYVSIGPVWETPTKPGRPAAGLELVRIAASGAATLPWFAIGGIDPGNVGEVTGAGARRIVVVRAIRDADDPAGAARELRAALEGADGDG